MFSSKALVIVLGFISWAKCDKLNAMLDELVIQRSEPKLRGSAKPDFEALYSVFKKQFKEDIEEPENQKLRFGQQPVFTHSLDAFKVNVLDVMDHNDRFFKQQVSYKKKLHMFSDVPLAQLHNRYVSNVTLGQLDTSNYKYKEGSGRVRGNRYIDWRSRGVMAPVRNQGQCGSCYAFAIVSVSEAQMALRKGRLTHLSEQQLVDCSQTNRGCYGAFLQFTAQYVQQRGLVQRNVYPYEMRHGPCREHHKAIMAKAGQVEYVYQGDEAGLIRLLQKTPVAVGVQVTGNFYQYSGGLFTDPQCQPSPNHAVVVVGFGIENGREYYLIRNSWGEWWGEQGHMKIEKRAAERCGILTMALAPIITQSG